MERLGPP